MCLISGSDEYLVEHKRCCMLSVLPCIAIDFALFFGQWHHVASYETSLSSMEEDMLLKDMPKAMSAIASQYYQTYFK